MLHLEVRFGTELQHREPPKAKSQAQRPKPAPEMPASKSSVLNLKPEAMSMTLRMDMLKFTHRDDSDLVKKLQEEDPSHPACPSSRSYRLVVCIGTASIAQDSTSLGYTLAYSHAP